MDDSVHCIFGEDAGYQLMITDITLDEEVIILSFDILQVLQIAGIGQGIEVDDHVVRILLYEEPDHMAAYEACTACYQNISLECSHIIHLPAYTLSRP